jgi:hypothetical protein
LNSEDLNVKENILRNLRNFTESKYDFPKPRYLQKCLDKGQKVKINTKTGGNFRGNYDTLKKNPT